jgi:hypothetical protein
MSRARLRLAALLILGLAAATPATAGADGRYVAIGDSIAGATDSYVDRFAARQGIADVHKLISGATASQALTSVLTDARRLIDDPTDTTVLSVQIGGHDFLTGNCPDGWNRPTCDYADSVAALLRDLRASLAADPGDERFLVVAYYNPSSGLRDARERMIDAGLHGTDGRIDTSGHGDAWGMTDVLGWLACRQGATLVDPWPAFHAGGQALMADTLHPNAAGHALLADLLERPEAGGAARACPPTTPFATTGDDGADGVARGVVEPRLAPARWWFEYGRTPAYGHATAPRALPPSAGARAVTAVLPVRGATTTYHVRLVTENDRGRFAGEDRTLTAPALPVVDAALSRPPTRRDVLAAGIPLRIRTSGTSVAVRARLRRRGPDPVIVHTRRNWTPGATRDITAALTRRGRRLVRATPDARIVLRVVAQRGGRTSRPSRLVVRLVTRAQTSGKPERKRGR